MEKLIFMKNQDYSRIIMIDTVNLKDFIMFINIVEKKFQKLAWYCEKLECSIFRT